MKSDWKIDSTICTVEYIVERIGHNRRDESRYRRPMGGNAPWASQHGRTRSSNRSVVTVLNQIYEADFKGFSYGFRGPQPASGIRRPDGGHPAKASELGTRCGHSWLLRQHESRVDDEVHPASSGRSPHASPDPEMVKGRRVGRWSVVGNEARYASGSSGFTTARERVPALCVRPVG